MAAGGVSSQATDVLGAVIVLAMITVFVRPGSQGPQLVSNFLGGFSNLVGNASTFGTPTTSGTKP